MAELAVVLRLPRREPAPCPADVGFGDWLAWAAPHADFELEPVSVTVEHMGEVLANCSPGLVRLSESELLVVVGYRAGKLRVLCPDGSRAQLPIAWAEQRVLERAEQACGDSVDAMLSGARLGERARRRARRFLLGESLGGREVTRAYLARLAPSSSLWSVVRHTGFIRRVCWLALAYLAEQATLLSSWAVIGAAALGGRLDSGWFALWLMLLLLLVPLRTLTALSEGRLSIELGAVVKSRLLAGSLMLDRDRVAHQGVGSLLGRCIEADLVERSFLSGGTEAVFAAVQLSLAVPVILHGAVPWAHGTLFLLMLGIAAVAYRHNLQAVRKATRARLDVAHELIDEMVGHQTRIVQQRGPELHRAEDQLVAAYTEESESLDISTVWFVTVVSKLWVACATLALLVPLWAGNASVAEVAISIGGILLIAQAFAGLTTGATMLARATVAWESVSEIFGAAKRRVPAGSVSSLVDTEDIGDRLIDARELTFSYGGSKPVLDGVSLTIGRGEKVLVEGHSGSGKSTLALLLGGLVQPSSGLLLAGGLDHDTLGRQGWRRRVVIAPQFHDNHVFLGSFEFNLLLGRNWPPNERDRVLARAICDELGLGLLIERMPGGLDQPIGETGWQLSHGERSRLFIARALLQGAPLVVLDESFAALDPETVVAVARCARERASALVVIAHP